MINYKIMFERIANGEELTTKILHECGFTQYDLTKLVDNGIFERIKRGHYQLKVIEIDRENDLYLYGKILTTKREYEKAMYYSKKLLEFGNPSSAAYARIGFLFIKMNKISLAIDYFTIATELSKLEDGRHDYSQTIEYLRGNIEYDEIKPRFAMEEDDFNKGVDDYYGIDNFEEINSYILESGLDVETACEELGLSMEAVNIVRLIYAKIYYSQGDYEKGDIFFKLAEKMPEKTDRIKKCIKDVRKNRNYFINRRDENTERLTLNLKPKK